MKTGCAKRVPGHKKPLGKFNLKRFKLHKCKRSSQAVSCKAQKESSNQTTALTKQHTFDDLKVSFTSAEHTGVAQIQFESGTLSGEGDKQFVNRITELTEQVKELENYLETTKNHKENLHSQLLDKDRELKANIAKLENDYSIAAAENELLKLQLKDKNWQLNAKDILLAEMTAEVKELEQSLCRATQKRIRSPDNLYDKSRNGSCKTEGHSSHTTKEMALVLAEREQEIVSLQQQLANIKEVRKT